MMTHFRQRHRDRLIEVVIEPGTQGIDAWFLIDGTARSMPKTFPGNDMDAAIAETIGAAREWVERRPADNALHAAPFAVGMPQIGAAALRPHS